MTMKNPSHPGEILREGYLIPLNVSVTKAAKMLDVTRASLSKILNGKGGISPQMAFKLGKAFNSDPHFWINLQVNYDMAQAQKTVNLDRVVVIFNT